jgi:hypothetical protein
MTSGSSLAGSLGAFLFDFMVNFRLIDGMSKHSVHDRWVRVGHARKPLRPLGKARWHRIRSCPGQFFTGFDLGFAADAVARNRTSFEPLDGDILPT